MNFDIFNIPTILGTLTVLGITWLIKHVSSTQLVIANFKHEVEMKMEKHTKTLLQQQAAIDRRLVKLEEWTIGHEKVEEEREKSLKERYRTLTKILEEVKVRQ